MSSFQWKEFPLFEKMQETDIRRFLSMGFHISYEAGAQLVSNKDQGETFFLLIQGMAKLVLVNAKRESFNVALFTAGDFFGEMAMLDPRSVRSGDIMAISNLEVVTFHKKEFLKMCQECPMLSFNLARNLAQRLRLMNERMVTNILPETINKVAHTLLLLSNKGKRFAEDGQILLPPLSLQEWAQFCHTSPEHFMSNIEALKEVGVLSWREQRIVITDLQTLQSFAHSDLSKEAS